MGNKTQPDSYYKKISMTDKYNIRENYKEQLFVQRIR